MDLIQNILLLSGVPQEETLNQIRLIIASKKWNEHHLTEAQVREIMLEYSKQMVSLLAEDEKKSKLN